MTDDLVKRLTILVSDTDTELLAIEAADRIEALEKALRETVNMLRVLNAWADNGMVVIGTLKYEAQMAEQLARAALGEKKDG